MSGAIALFSALITSVDCVSVIETGYDWASYWYSDKYERRIGRHDGRVFVINGSDGVVCATCLKDVSRKIRCYGFAPTGALFVGDDAMSEPLAFSALMSKLTGLEVVVGGESAPPQGSEGLPKRIPATRGQPAVMTGTKPLVAETLATFRFKGPQRHGSVLSEGDRRLITSMGRCESVSPRDNIVVPRHNLSEPGIFALRRCYREVRGVESVLFFHRVNNVLRISAGSVFTNEEVVARFRAKILAAELITLSLAGK